MAATFYQDAAKTTPVTASGDPVGAIVLTDGTIPEFTQATAANRPIYRSDGTRGWLETNGVSQFLEADYAPTAYPLTMAVAVEFDSQAGVNAILSLYESNSLFKRLYVQPSPSNFIYQDFGNGSQSVSATVTDKSVVFAQDDSTTALIEVNGGAPSSGANAGPFGSPTKLYIGNTGPQGSYFSGKIFGAIFVNRLLTDAEKADVRAKLASAAGATLI